MPAAGDDMDASSGGPHHSPPPSASFQQLYTREPSATLPILGDSSQLPGVRTQFWETAQEVISGIHQGMSVLRLAELEAVMQANQQILDRMLAETQRIRAVESSMHACVSSGSAQHTHVQHQSPLQSTA